MNVATVEQQQESWAGSRGVLAKNDFVTPMTREVRASDRIALPSWALTVILAFFSAAAGAWGANWGLRSKMDIIEARLQGRADIDALAAKSSDDRLRRMEDDIRELKKAQQDAETRLRAEIRMKPYDEDMKKRTGR